VAASIDHGLALLHNESNAGGVTLKLQPRRVGEMIGTRVELTVAGCRSARVLSGGGSYLSYSPAEVHFGIGTERRIDRIDVTWPDGQSECWRNVVATPSITLVQGTGIPVVRTDSNRP
jgi:hypothetical protein